MEEASYNKDLKFGAVTSYAGNYASGKSNK
jgi:hypothetical protein